MIKDELYDKATVDEFIEEINDALADEKRAYRISQCETFGTSLDARTGAKKVIPHHCQCWRQRECIGCFNRRVDKEYERLEYQLKLGRMFKTITTNPNKFARRLRKVGNLTYRRYEQVINGQSRTVFLHEGKDDIHGTPVIESDLTSEWVAQLVDSPGKSRVTGKMGTKPNPDDGLERQVINIPQVTIPKEIDFLVNEMFYYTILETQFNPQTFEEVERAVTTRMAKFYDRVVEVYEDYLRSKGNDDAQKIAYSECRLTTRKQSIALEELNWVETTNNIIVKGEQYGVILPVKAVPGVDFSPAPVELML